MSYIADDRVQQKLLRLIFLSHKNFKNIATPTLSNLGYPSATPLNFAEFGAPEIKCEVENNDLASSLFT